MSEKAGISSCLLMNITKSTVHGLDVDRPADIFVMQVIESHSLF